MMMLMVYVERISTLGKGKEKESIEWTADGKTFVISHVKHFTSTWLLMLFGSLKFTSFTRKLYRWGFKKIRVYLSVKDGQHGEVLCFGNENFQRDDLTLLPKMRSVTEPKYRHQKPTESIEPDTFNRFLLPVQSSRSRAGQSVPIQNAAGLVELNVNLHSSWISQGLSAPNVLSHHQGHVLHQQ